MTQANRPPTKRELAQEARRVEQEELNRRRREANRDVDDPDSVRRYRNPEKPKRPNVISRTTKRVPNVPGWRGVNPKPKPQWNATRTVTILWLFSFILYVSDRGFPTNIDQGRSDSTFDFLRSYAAWAMLYVVLIGATDIEATRSLAVAFALVIFLSMLIIAPSAKDANKSVGVQVFEKWSKFIIPSQPFPNSPNET